MQFDAFDFQCADVHGGTIIQKTWLIVYGFAFVSGNGLETGDAPFLSHGFPGLMGLKRMP